MIGIITLLFVGLVGAADFPNDIGKCPAGDTQCLPPLITKIVKEHPKGHSGLRIPVLEPMKIGAVHIVQGSQNNPVIIDLQFRNLELTGLSKAVITKVVGFERDPTKSKFEVTATVPRITMKGDYKIDGRVLLLPIQGAGRSVLHFEDVNIVIKFIPHVTVKDNKYYIQTEKFKIDYDPKGIKLHFSNLFNGNKALGDNMNQFLNENSREILRELKPTISQSVKNLLKNIINDIFRDISYSDIYS